MSLDIPLMIKRIRGYANQRSSSETNAFYNDDEIKDFIQQNWNALYYKMVKARENYFVEQITKELSGQDNSIAIPYYRILKVDYKYGESSYQKITRGTLRSQNRFENRSFYESDIPFNSRSDEESNRIWIPIKRGAIEIYPVNRANGVYRIYYVPEPPVISDLTINIPTGFDNYIVLMTAIDIGIPEEGDLKNLMTKLQYWEDKIDDWMSDVSGLAPRSIDRVIDFSGDNEEGYIFDEGAW